MGESGGTTMVIIIVCIIGMLFATGDLHLPDELNPNPTPTPNPTPSPTPINLGPNLAIMPSAWRVGETWCAPTYVDTLVTHNGHISIRMEKGADATKSREIEVADKSTNDWGIPVSPGDRIIFKAWLKTSESSFGDTCIVSGIRIGVDFYATESGHYISGVSTPNGDYAWTPGGYASAELQSLNYVHWGSDWTQRTMDFIVKDQYYADPGSASLNIYPLNTLVAPARCMPWVHIFCGNHGNMDEGVGWFADTEVYIVHNH